MGLARVKDIRTFSMEGELLEITAGIKEILRLRDLVSIQETKSLAEPYQYEPIEYPDTWDGPAIAA